MRSKDRLHNKGWHMAKANWRALNQLNQKLQVTFYPTFAKVPLYVYRCRCGHKTLVLISPLPKMKYSNLTVSHFHKVPATIHAGKAFREEYSIPALLFPKSDRCMTLLSAGY
jgi:hypothetical protein